jgi:hypothetical protein
MKSSKSSGPGMTALKLLPLVRSSAHTLDLQWVGRSRLYSVGTRVRQPEDGSERVSRGECRRQAAVRVWFASILPTRGKGTRNSTGDTRAGCQAPLHAQQSANASKAFRRYAHVTRRLGR